MGFFSAASFDQVHPSPTRRLKVMIPRVAIYLNGNFPVGWWGGECIQSAFEGDYLFQQV